MTFPVGTKVRYTVDDSIGFVTKSDEYGFTVDQWSDHNDSVDFYDSEKDDFEVIETAPERAGRVGDSQPLPTKNDHLDIQSQVIKDILDRRQVGISRYGTALQPHNGRNALQDAYEEAIDLAMYLKQRLVEDGE
jgi:hypothetical protein